MVKHNTYNIKHNNDNGFQSSRVCSGLSTLGVDVCLILRQKFGSLLRKEGELTRAMLQ